ncbi:TLDc domain-containing protein [Mycena venus]|uniref:TLDc domain-containing protein n=1 Tax=Mycena venus TaxID=2733690 RepID=A0A8H6Z4W6_9AGAR|nr:TLDc domain-containing protein [Mycena venus]
MSGVHAYDDEGECSLPMFDPRQLYSDSTNSGGNGVFGVQPPTNNSSPHAYSETSATVSPYSNVEFAHTEFDEPKTPRNANSTSHPIPRWSPPLLSVLPMAAFGLFLVLLIVALEMLNSHSPYTAPSSGMLFFWTYFPVAILMVVEWIWAAYDLQVKVLVPWAAMSRGFTPAHESWLLDYVSSNYFLNIWNAVRYRHVVVLLTTLGLWTTAIAGVVTTSLFQLEDMLHTSPAMFTRMTELDYSLSADPSVLLNLMSNKEYLNSYLGREVLSLSRPRWTTAEDIVMEAYADSSPAPTTERMVAPTRGYSADLNCTPSTVAYAGKMAIGTAIHGPPTTAYQFLLNITSVRAPPSPFPAPPAWDGILQYINSTNSAGIGEDGLPLTEANFQMDPWEIWGNAAISEESCDCDPWFYLVGHGQNISDLELFNAEMLANASKTTFQGVWADLAQTLLFTDSNTSSPSLIEGTVTMSDPRLVAKQTSVRVAQAALGVLVLVTIAVWVLQPRADLPMDPASIAAQAFFLKHSNDTVANAVRSTVTMDNEATNAILKDWEFTVKNEGDFTIVTRWKGDMRLPMVPSSPGVTPKWRPFILHPMIKIVLALVLIATIIALELALRRSDTNHGFADLNSSNQNLWTYLAPVYLFFLGIFLSSYTFSVSSLQPYFAMSAPQPAHKSVRYSPAQRTSLGLLLHALRYQNLVGLASAGIMLLVPILKIAVAGPVTTAATPVNNQTQITLTTTFNTNATIILDDDSANKAGNIMALAQIQEYQLPLPPWTTVAGAVGHVDLGQLGGLTVAPNTTVTIPLPVMRGDLLDCAALPATNNFTLLTNPPSLQLPSDYVASGVVWRTLLPFVCGTVVAFYGNTQATNITAVDTFTAVQCSYFNLSMSTQSITLVYDAQNVDILSIDPAKRNTIVVNTDPLNDTEFLWDSLPLPPANFDANTSHAFDSFFQILTLQNRSIPLDAYLDAPTLSGAMQALYTVYWSVYAALNLVISVNSTEPVPALVSYSHMRIVQAATPTRILQSLLACVLALGMLTAVFVRKTTIGLAKAPYGIGATMGMLADSMFVELDALQDVRQEADLDVVLEPYAFRLGWGSNGRGGSRFGIDVILP